MNRAQRIISLFEEAFEDSKFGDDSGRQWRVKSVVSHAEANKKKYYHAKIPIHKLTHDLSWWDKQHSADPKKSTARMKASDTSYPLLVLKDKGHLSVADGLNRLKKATSIEGKTHVSAYIVPKKHIKHLALPKEK